MAVGRSDRELVVRALEGDQEAFGELVARYRSAVVGVAFHRTGSFEEARDIAQETFLKAYLSLPKLRRAESFASWLYHIADLTALGVARRPQREVPLPDEETVHPPEAAASELSEQVREALAALDEPTRLAVVLHYIDGYSHAEVANFLGTTAGAVRTRVSRAKSRLREEIMGETERELREAVERVLAAGNRQMELYRSNSLLGKPEEAQAAFERAKEAAEELRRGYEAAGKDREAWREQAFIMTANVGILGRYWSDTHEALALLRKAEQLAGPDSPVSPVLFYLAAAILQTGGDRQEALQYLRRALSDKRWAATGVPREEFFRDPAFEGVREDREFVEGGEGGREVVERGE